MSIQNILATFIFFTASVCFGNCLSEGRIQPMAGTDGQTHMYVHEYNGKFALHSCQGSQCEVYQVASPQRLCQIEKNSSRLHAAVVGAFKQITIGAATGGVDLVKVAIRQAITQAGMRPECPGTQLVQVFSSSNDFNEELQAYYRVGRQAQLVPMGWPNPDNDRIPASEHRNTALRFALFHFPTIFSDGNFPRSVSPFLGNGTVDISEESIQNYCQFFD